MDPNELLQERAALVKEARELNDLVVREKRSMTAEETQKFEKLMTAAREKKSRADQLTELAAAEAEINATAVATEEADLDAPRERRSQANAGNPAPNPDDVDPDVAQRRELRSGLRALQRFMATGEVQAPSREQRAGAPWTTTDAAGGYMAPTAVANEVITRVQDLVYMLAGSRVFRLMDAKAIQIPKLTTGMSSASWGAESAAVTADAAAVFGAATLTPVRLSMLGYVSNNLIFSTGNLAEQAILYEIAKGMAEGMEEAFVAGTGSSQPTGAFNETSSLTTREVHSTSQTGFDWTDLATAVGNQRATYRRNASWLVHRDFVTRSMKLKDGEGRPVWIPSVEAGKPDRILGYPVWESEFASNTFTADKRIAVFGDFSRGYGIAITLGMRLLRLVEKYAEYDATGWAAHAYADGKVVDDNALTALHTAV